jgi:electron transport complex protein RnfC
MISVEPRQSEEILKGLDREKRVFFIGCSGWKTLCNPGGEAQLQRMKKELELRGVSFTGTMVIDALCNKGLDELSLLRQFRQVLRSQVLLVMSCEVGVQALSITSGRMIIPALRTLSAEGFQGVLGEKEPCRLCGDCLLDLAGGLCPLYFCPKGLLNGPCQGAYRGRCEVDAKKACGWELIYERLKDQGRLEGLKNYAEPRDHSEILPLIRLRSKLAEEIKDGLAITPEGGSKR